MEVQLNNYDYLNNYLNNLYQELVLANNRINLIFNNDQKVLLRGS